MFCPYVRKTYTRLTIISYNDELQAENGSIIHEKYTNEECQKEKCGVWYKGKCNFKL